MVRALNTGSSRARSSPAPILEVRAIRWMPSSSITVRVLRVTSVMNMGGLTGLVQGLSDARELSSAPIAASGPLDDGGGRLDHPAHRAGDQPAGVRFRHPWRERHAGAVRPSCRQQHGNSTGKGGGEPWVPRGRWMCWGSGPRVVGCRGGGCGPGRWAASGFAFYVRMSTEDFQDRVSSCGWQREFAAELVAGHVTWWSSPTA